MQALGASPSASVGGGPAVAATRWARDVAVVRLCGMPPINGDADAFPSDVQRLPLREGTWCPREASTIDAGVGRHDLVDACAHGRPITFSGLTRHAPQV